MTMDKRMDMDMDMGGMDMGGSGLFRGTNMGYARGYWYGVAACVGLLLVIRLIDSTQAWLG